MKKIIIAISGKAQAGKTTINEIITDIIVKRPGTQISYMPFAKKLKEICRDLFDWDGSKEIYKNQDGLALQDTGRMLLINVGNKMREIRATIWCDYVIDQIKHCSNSVWATHAYFIIDDLRYKNELESLKNCGIDLITIRIERDTSLHLDHISERDLDDSKFDHVIINNGSIGDLRNELEKII